MRIFAVLVLVIFVFSCKEQDTADSKVANPEAIFLDYKISGEEDRDFVTCLIQFRYGGEDGNGMVLQKPASVKLDGQELNADSVKMIGAFYEVQMPVEQFAGEHVITFTDVNNKQYKETFRFTPFSLRKELPETVKRDSFSLFLQNVGPGTAIRYVLADTSFTTEDLNEVQKMSSEGRIIFTRTEIGKLKPGPVTLLLSREEERRVKTSTREGGRISISYSLRREFELVD